MTQAVVIVIERSPGGGNGYNVTWGTQSAWMCGARDKALDWVRRSLVVYKATPEEVERVMGLLARELERKPRAEVTAEVPVLPKVRPTPRYVDTDDGWKEEAYRLQMSRMR
jgi:hypothetical protein